MPSPFPGMDPYLEDPAYWRDFHGEFIYACRHLLLDRLPAAYYAAVDEQLRLVEVGPDELSVRREKDVLPDVAVTRSGAASRQSRQPGVESVGERGGGGLATLEPVAIEVEVEAQREERNRWITIIHRPDDALVTVIEVLSPTNKNSDGYADYRAKRAALLRQRVNLVELDLLLGGRRMEDPARLPAGDYFAIIRQPETPTRRLVYAWPLRHRLPAVSVPLRPPDGDVQLDLSAALAAAYERGRYEWHLRYGRPPAAPVRPDDLHWVQELAKSVR